MREDDSSVQVGALLGRLRTGEPSAADELLRLVHDELHGMARRFMADQKAAHTLQATALVNEAWLRLAAAGVSPEGRAHFLRVAATAMRSVLVDHARRRLADKRGGGRRPRTLGVAVDVGVADDGAALLTLHEALEGLAKQDAGAAQVAEMRLFAGMEHAEVGRALDVSTRTVERRWRFARAWLQRELELENEEPERSG